MASWRVGTSAAMLRTRTLAPGTADAMRCDAVGLSWTDVHRSGRRLVGIGMGGVAVRIDKCFGCDCDSKYTPTAGCPKSMIWCLVHFAE
ncbi:hypothetical protein HOY82DRAFT_566510 [Tuber indicum]|nr:hypothetical protein HOY82DRAFT_566510 [Tuber indicum]